MNALARGGAIVALALVPAVAHAQGTKQDSGIWIQNKTRECAWITVYTGGKQVRMGGWPAWVYPLDSAVYPIEHRGSGQQYKVRAEFKKPSTGPVPMCADAPKLEGDISTVVSQGLAYQVRLTGTPGNYTITRF